MDFISLLKKTKFSNSVWWKLKIKVQGFQDELSNNLVTEILENRCFRVVEKDLCCKKWKYKTRILIQLFEDGYLCWVNKDQLFCEQLIKNKRVNKVCDETYIESQIPFILSWIKDQSVLTNKYLWGGTCGPNYDCSGLIQTAFLRHNIFLPRDSYQMKNFCSHISNFPGDIHLLKKGDILFFGNQINCNHVGIYDKDGCYYHSSGKYNGRDGIGKDTLLDTDNLISSHYKSKLISAGRVTRSYQWDKVLR
tara:strand:- start:2273 stop:3022 length:750 start_codon:yes stop_codon:yes gene_type:complete